jgi:dTDP-4-dehydrorhamnose reductase
MSASPTQSVAGNPPGNPRILIVGNAGQLGRELERIFAGFGSIVAVDHESVDLADPDQTRSLMRRAAPDLILNAAAYTAVDRAESEPALAHAINAQAPRILAEQARQRNALFVHYSTDYVFDGRKPEPWSETNKPNPLNVYGASKQAGEQAIENIGGKYLIFRTSWVYGPHGNNFLLTMLRLAREPAAASERGSISVVDDQFGAPTTSIELARATHAIVGGILAGRFGAPQDWAGLYHMTCAGSTSWFGFAQAIFARVAVLLDIKIPELIPIATKDYPTPAERPRNSVLSNAKLHARFAVQLPAWQSALEEVLQSLRPGSQS